MYVKEVTVENQVGLHARPATFFIQQALSVHAALFLLDPDGRLELVSLLDKESSRTSAA